MTEISSVNRFIRQLEAIEGMPLRPEQNMETVQVSVRLEEENSCEMRTLGDWLAQTRRLRCELVCTRLMGKVSKEIEDAIFTLERLELSLIYRESLPNCPPQVSRENLVLELSKIIGKYKKNGVLYPGSDGRLTQHDQNQIDELCRKYPLFANNLIRRASKGGTRDPLISGFVKFCLRSCGASNPETSEAAQRAARVWVDIFVQYPHETDELIDAMLDKRLGAVDPSLIFIGNKADGTPVVCMKMDGNYEIIQGNSNKDRVVSLKSRVSIYDPNYELSIREIYQQFTRKREGYEKVEVGEAGVINWDTINLGSYNPVTKKCSLLDSTHLNWLFNLPIWRRVDEAGLKARYDDRLDNKPNTPDQYKQMKLAWEGLPHNEQFAMAFCATRTTTNRNLELNHSYLELILPDPDQPGIYRIIPIGFQPIEFPKNILDKLVKLLDTHPAQLHIFDESACLTQRQRYSDVSASPPSEFQQTQLALGTFVLKGRAGKEVFQFTQKNCAGHIQKVRNNSVGKRFYAPFAKLAANVLHKRQVEVSAQIKEIAKNGNDETLNKLATFLAVRLLHIKDEENIRDLVSLCLKAIAQASHMQLDQIGVTVDSIMEEVKAAIKKEGHTIVQLKENLIKLIKFSFDSQQLYKMPVWDLEADVVLLGSIFRAIRSLENWPKLRIFLLRALFFILGSWRGYSYVKKDGTTVKTIRVHSAYSSGRTMTLPSQIFYQKDKMRKQREALSQMFPSNAVIAGLHNSAIPTPPQGTRASLDVFDCNARLEQQTQSLKSELQKLEHIRSSSSSFFVAPQMEALPI